MVLEHSSEIGDATALFMKTSQLLPGLRGGGGAIESLQVFAETFLFEMGI